jgi:hypothetical protein
MQENKYPKKLNLGSGHFPKKGYLNVDFNPLENPDLILDLNNPKALEVLPSGHFEHIVLDHVLEHLSDVFGTMKQIHILLAKEGIVEIRVPHFSRGFTHPEHQRSFDVTFPEYMNPKFPGGYIGVELVPVSVKLSWMIRFDLKEPYVAKWQLSILKIINSLVSFVANISPTLCSRFWCYYVGGFEQVEFIFKKN